MIPEAGAHASYLRNLDRVEDSSASMHITAERQALLQQEQDHQKALISIRYQLNGTTPIGKLPAEVISEIFRWVAFVPTSKPHYASIYSSSTACYTWVTILCVCRRWHEVAMATPDLWSLIEVAGNRKVIDTCLTRSKNALLDVITEAIPSGYSPLSPHMLPVLRNILHHAHRIRTINFSLRHTDYLEVMKGLPQVCLPRLRYLTVSTSGPLNLAQPSNFTFGSLDCPDMRELSITRCEFPLEKIIDYKNLTSLTIDLSNYIATKAPSETQVLDVLRATSDLVTLRLFNVFLPGGLATNADSAESPEMPKDHRILLPRLSSAELSGNAAAIASILRHVHFPSTARLLLPSMSSRSPADIETLIGPLQARLDGSAALGPSVHLQTMHIEAYALSPVTIHCWVKSSHGTGLAPEAELPSEEEPDFAVCYPIYAIDLGALSTMPLHNVQSLWLMSRRKYPAPPSFARVYKHFRGVLELRLRNFSTDAIIKMLDVPEAPEGSEPQDGSADKTPMQVAGTDSGTEVAVGYGEAIPSSSSRHSRPLSPADFNFPNLQALYVRNPRSRQPLYPMNDVIDHKSQINSLHDVLKKRQKAGMKVPRLVECTASPLDDYSDTDSVDFEEIEGFEGGYDDDEDDEDEYSDEFDPDDHYIYPGHFFW